MSTNLEIKAYCSDLPKVESKVKKIDAKYLGLDQQIDTYFNTKKGRFKLRESSLSGSYLIPYIRPDQNEAKLSLYEKIVVSEVDRIKNIFGHLFGIHCIVKKKRSIYLYENVRIHLDDVENLGSFIEFEAVFDELNNDETLQQNKIDFLMSELGISKDSLISVSYENMITLNNM